MGERESVGKYDVRSHRGGVLDTRLLIYEWHSRFTFNALSSLFKLKVSSCSLKKHKPSLRSGYWFFPKVFKQR